MVKPFVVSLMADPSGAYTTAAAMVACVEAALRKRHVGRAGRQARGDPRRHRAGGPHCRRAGGPGGRARCSLSSRGGTEAAQQAASETGKRFGVTLHGVSGARSRRRCMPRSPLPTWCSAAPRPACRCLGSDDLGVGAKRLLVAADLNAVPPEGIAGVGVMDDAKPLAGTAALGIGALAVGNVKYQTQHRLLVQMREAEKAVVLASPRRLATARAVVGREPEAGLSARRAGHARRRCLSPRACWPRARARRRHRGASRSTCSAMPTRGAPRRAGCRSASRRRCASMAHACSPRCTRWRSRRVDRLGRRQRLRRPARAAGGGARILPLMGPRAADVRRVRDPLAFFDGLRAHAIAHPPVRFDAAASRRPAGCTRTARGCGGWHVRGAAAQGRPALRQLLPASSAPGRRCRPPSSPTAAMPSCSASTSCSCARSASGPIVFCRRDRPGAAERGHAARDRRRGARAGARAFALRGLASLDFVLRRRTPSTCSKLNPRPPASLALYAPCRWTRRAACSPARLPCSGVLPPAPAPADRRARHRDRVCAARVAARRRQRGQRSPTGPACTTCRCRLARSAPAIRCAACRRAAPMPSRCRPCWRGAATRCCNRWRLPR